MKSDITIFDDKKITVHTCNTVIIGTGAAGYNAADTLFGLGQTDIAIVTNGIYRGTSRNTGSDKQTYYKLSLSGSCPDSIGAMAADLFAGGCVDGDIALCEAAGSVSSFIKLCRIGVDFPTNRYGEYVGYQTDHDTAGRATSVGPLTSKEMTEKLEAQIEKKNISRFDRHQVIRILTDENGVRGLLCYDEVHRDYVVFNCTNLVYATGGPAGLYDCSVYPESQFGASGAAFEAGVIGKNLTEWQFGLASLAPRWNVSGTYMQVLPRFVSIDDQGNEHEFVTDYYQDASKALSMIFKKGYQWPFDVRKINGSSLIDLLVYRETEKFGRKVYLDFTQNPLNTLPDFENLEPEARDYLKSAHADFGTPVERLLQMNTPAYDLYKDKGVDLKTDYLPVAVCAQHNNGGLDVDCWWQSNLPGLFPCGEVAGSHGVFRPGGSALNAGQVGSYRAARYIAANRRQQPGCTQSLLRECGDQIAQTMALIPSARHQTGSVREAIHEAQCTMTAVGGIVRNRNAIGATLKKLQIKLEHFSEQVPFRPEDSIAEVYQYHDQLLAMQAYLTAMYEFAGCGNSRGSALYTNPDGDLPDGLPEEFRYVLDEEAHTDVILETFRKGNDFACRFRPVRPLPEGGGFFENVWKSYRENQNIE